MALYDCTERGISPPQVLLSHGNTEKRIAPYQPPMSESYAEAPFLSIRRASLPACNKRQDTPERRPELMKQLSGECDSMTVETWEVMIHGYRRCGSDRRTGERGAGHPPHHRLGH